MFALIPAWRFATFYFVFFAAMGAMVPYWTLYLKDQGFGPGAIGLTVGLMTLTQIIAPNFWGVVADRWIGPARTIKLVLGIAIVAFAGLLIPGGILWIVSVLLVYGFFWRGALPQFEVLTLRRAGGDIAVYGRVRLWGSVGFLVAVVACGQILKGSTPGIVPMLVLPLLALTWAASKGFADPPVQAKAADPSTRRRFVANRGIVVFLVGCFLMQATHGPFYAFFSIHLESLGYGSDVIGALWAAGVLAEIAAFVFMGRLTSSFALRSLFLLTFVLGAARWLIVAELSGSLIWLALSQLLHAATFGVFHAVAVRLVHTLFPPAYHGRGQALYSSVGFGLGGGLGSAVSGQAWTTLGPELTWLGAAFLSMLGYALCRLGLPRNLESDADRNESEPR